MATFVIVGFCWAAGAQDREAAVPANLKNEAGTTYEGRPDDVAAVLKMFQQQQQLQQQPWGHSLTPQLERRLDDERQPAHELVQDGVRGGLESLGLQMSPNFKQEQQLPVFPSQDNNGMGTWNWQVYPQAKRGAADASASFFPIDVPPAVQPSVQAAGDMPVYQEPREYQQIEYVYDKSHQQREHGREIGSPYLYALPNAAAGHGYDPSASSVYSDLSGGQRLRAPSLYNGDMRKLGKRYFQSVNPNQPYPQQFGYYGNEQEKQSSSDHSPSHATLSEYRSLARFPVDRKIREKLPQAKLKVDRGKDAILSRIKEERIPQSRPPEVVQMRVKVRDQPTHSLRDRLRKSKNAPTAPVPRQPRQQDVGTESATVDLSSPIGASVTGIPAATTATAGKLRDRSVKVLGRRQRSVEDGSVLGKLSEWACMGRTIDGETVYCDSILDYAKLLGVLVGVTAVVTVSFVFLIHVTPVARKTKEGTCLDDDEETGLLPEDEDHPDELKCDFRDDTAKRLFIEILKNGTQGLR